ncbi:MAG: hypothetical protein ACLFV4_04430 [Candidatus Hydrogenedentota bacterium]
MKKHYKAHVRPISCIPQKAQAPLQLKFDTVTQAVETLLLFQRMAPWKTVPWWSGNGDDDDDDDNGDNGVL